MSTSNNAVVLLKGQTHGDIKEGETLKFEKHPYEFTDLKDGDFVVKALYLSSDPYLVRPLHIPCVRNGLIKCREDELGMRVSSLTPL